MMPRRPGITLCVMVKDDAASIGECLSSAAAVVQRILVADTGSTDGTLDVVRKYTSDITEVPFGRDFSGPRNHLLSLVDTEWVLVLDADECLLPEHAVLLKHIVEAATAETMGYRLLRYDFFAGGGWYSGRRLRLFRSHDAIRYQGRINEDVAESIRALGGRIEGTGVIFNHFGHCRPFAIRQAKAERYLRMTEAELLDDPYDGERVAYRAMHLRALGRFDEALAASQLALRLSPESTKAMIFRGHALRGTGDHLGAKAAYLRAVQIDETRASYWSLGALHNLIGVMELMMGDLRAAKQSLETARENDPDLVHVVVNLGLVAETERDFAAAVQCYQEAAQRNPAFLWDAGLSRLEFDPFSAYCYETVDRFAGLARHLAYCEQQLRLSRSAGRLLNIPA